MERKAKNTHRAYSASRRDFQAWCFAAGHEPMPATPQTITLYLVHLTSSTTPRGGKYSAETLSLRLSAIAHFHRECGANDPTKHPMVTGLMKGIHRDLAGRPRGTKAALLAKHLRRGLREPKRFIDVRNRALLTISYAAALGPSQLVGIDIKHLDFDQTNRLRVTLATQHGEQHIRILPGSSDLCPVRALREWLRLSGISSGAVFRNVNRHGRLGRRLSEDAIRYIIKQVAARAGLNPAQFSGLSPRIGHMTVALAASSSRQLGL